MSSRTKNAAESREAGKGLVEPLDTTPQAVAQYERILEYMGKALRRDAIISKLDCPPRLIDDAIKYRETQRKAAPDSGPATSESPQSAPPETPAAIGQEVGPPIVPAESAGPTEAPQKAEATVVTTKPKHRRHKRRTGLSWRQQADTAMARQPEEASPSAPTPVMQRTVLPATDDEYAKVKPTVDILFEDVYAVCRTNITELTSADGDDFHVESYRYALLLVLDFLDIRPEIVASRLGLSNEAALVAFEQAVLSLRGRGSAAQFYAQGLCGLRNINFRMFLAHYRKR